jgi:hypothetical protein
MGPFTFIGSVKIAPHQVTLLPGDSTAISVVPCSELVGGV